MAQTESAQFAITLNFRGQDYEIETSTEQASLLLNDQIAADQFMCNLLFGDEGTQALQITEESGSVPSTQPSNVRIWKAKTPTTSDDEATVVLLRKRSELDALFTNRKTNKLALWKKIAETLIDSGFQLDDDKPEIQCRQKFSNLEKSYKKHILDIKTTGSKYIARPPHFDMLHDILGKKDKCNPIQLVDSLEPGNSSTSVSNTPSGSPNRHDVETNQKCKKRPANTETTTDSDSDGIENVDKKTIKNRFTTIKSVKPKSSFQSAIVQELKRQHEETREDRNRQFEILQNLFESHNKQRERMLNLLEKAVHKNS